MKKKLSNKRYQMYDTKITFMMMLQDHIEYYNNIRSKSKQQSTQWIIVRVSTFVFQKQKLITPVMVIQLNIPLCLWISKSQYTQNQQLYGQEYDHTYRSTPLLILFHAQSFLPYGWAAMQSFVSTMAHLAIIQLYLNQLQYVK